MARIETLLERNDGVPTDPHPLVNNFQEWVQNRFNLSDQAAIEKSRDQLAGKVWLAKGAPQDGGASVLIDQRAAEELMIKAYCENNTEAGNEIGRLWGIRPKAKP